MRAVVQRVESAAILVEGEEVGRINTGLLVYVGVGKDDQPDDVETLAAKIRGLRIFPDAGGKMNLDVVQAGGGVLVVSNFTLCGDARAGRRPDFTAAAPPEGAEPLYEQLVLRLRELGVTVATGRFRAMMKIQAVGDGPINILLDSKKQF
jgi:D-tyrosyl-tRNA(Tyr) deacylase